MKLALAFLALCPGPAAAAINFLVIQPDDMDFYSEWNPPALLPWTPGSYPGADYPSGSSLPWINKLRTDGLEMTQAYAASPKCGTSRYSTITGRYASRSAHARNRGHGDPPPANVEIPKTKLRDTNANDGADCSHGNLAQVFSKNGWATGMVGKWHLSSMSDINDVKLDVESCGFDDVEAMYPDNIMGQAWAVDTHHNMEYVAYKAVEFITDNKDDPEGWFLYMNPTAPHGPSIDEALDVDCRSTVDGDFSDPAHPEYPGLGWNVSAMTENFGGDCALYRQNVRDRAAGGNDADLGSIWVDDAIGAVYTALNRTGQLANTVIVFQLDHGKVNKDEIWEGGIRIPQFVHYPDGNLVNSTFNGLVSTIDIGPTLVELAGIESSNPHMYDMDGKSWKSAVADAAVADEWRANRCLFFESNLNRAVRCGWCDKFLMLDAASDEISTAVANVGREGWSGYDAATAEVYADLCDASGNYVTAENNPNKYSGEADNEAAQEPDKVDDLRDLLNCHMARTGQAGALMDKTVAPQYTMCTHSGIASPSPTVIADPLLPVASSDVPELVDNDPLVDDIRNTHSAQVIQAIVLSPSVQWVRFNVQDPTGAETGFSGATQATLESYSGHESTHEFQVDTTGKPGKWGYRIRISDHNGNQVNLPADGSFIEFFVADDAEDVLECARGRIADLCDAEPGLAAKFVRHGFHDCVGGCDGCVNMEDGDNAGLDIPIDRLKPVVDLFAIEGITRADIWVLAALEAARGAQPTPDPGYNLPFEMEWYGRPTCETLYMSAECQDGKCDETHGPVGDAFHLPSPNLDTHELLAFFSGAFDFDARETVAIMGAHSLGVLAQENSGYDGPNGWKPGNQVLDNIYHRDLVGGDAIGASDDVLEDGPNWQQVEVVNADPIPNRWQWERGGGNTFVMINSDIALVRDFSAAGDLEATGEANCKFKCTLNPTRCARPANRACPLAAGTIQIVEEYKHNAAAFISDFEAAYQKMFRVGEFDTEIVPCETFPCEVGPTGRRKLQLRGTGK